MRASRLGSSSPWLRAAVPAILGLLAGACGAPSRRPEVAIPVASANAPAPTAQPPVAAPLVALFVRSIGSRREVWRVGADLAGARPIGLEIEEIDDSPAVGTFLGRGSEWPVLSPDGRWLAYGEPHTLYLRDLDAGVSTPVFELKKGEARIILDGFSPDGAVLLFQLGRRVDGDYEPPLPPGLDTGFYQVTLADRRVVPLPDLRGFDAWEDARHVLYLDRTRGAALKRSSLDGREEVTLQRLPSARYFSSMAHARGDVVALENAEQIVRMKLNGTGRVELTPRGHTEEWGPPQPSPDGALVAWSHALGEEPAIESVMEVVRATGRPGVVMRCQRRCGSYGWEGPRSLLAIDDEKLFRVAIGGTKTLVGTDAIGLILAGE